MFPVLVKYTLALGYVLSILGRTVALQLGIYFIVFFINSGIDFDLPMAGENLDQEEEGTPQGEEILNTPPMRGQLQEARQHMLCAARRR